MSARLAALLLCALPLAPIPPLRAQVDPGAQPAARPIPEDQTVTLQFVGGTYAEFVAAVRAVQPKANIVLATEAGAALVPAMVLKNAGIEQALEGAAMAADAEFDVRVKEFRGTGWPVYSIVAYVRPGNAGPTGAAAPAGPGMCVFSLNELTGEQPNHVQPFTVKTILGALRLATDEPSPPDIKFHEDSGLLLVRGTRQQQQVVQQTLSTLRDDLLERQRRAQQVEQQRQAEANRQAQRTGDREAPR